jgi:sialate O-acetylesterase
MLATVAALAAHLSLAAAVPALGRAATPPAAPFRWSNAMGDGMVLQSSPALAVVWGFAPKGAKVSVTFGGKSIAAEAGTFIGETTFTAKLPATPASLTEMHNITATSGTDTITLGDVLFGDVWVCSGQSNMAYPIGSPTCWNESNINCTVRDAQCGYGCVNNSAAEIKAMANWPHLRLFENLNGGSKVPLADSKSSGWKTPEAFGGGFSAACWFFGRDVYDALETKRPIGLMATHVGGTPDQHWSSPDAIDKCKGSEPWDWPANFTDSVLWNGKVVPLLKTTIKGAIWYQGEANSRADGRQYNCSFPAMIEDWRAKWAEYNGESDPAFPFGWAQLNSNGGAEMYPAPTKNSASAGDPLGQWSAGFPSIRNAESHTLSLKNTFQAVIVVSSNLVQCGARSALLPCSVTHSCECLTCVCACVSSSWGGSSLVPYRINASRIHRWLLVLSTPLGSSRLARGSHVAA